jgi:hypothetical protein
MFVAGDIIEAQQNMARRTVAIRGFNRHHPRAVVGEANAELLVLEREKHLLKNEATPFVNKKGLGRWQHCAQVPESQKFFGCFFQKRTACFC